MKINLLSTFFLLLILVSCHQGSKVTRTTSKPAKMPQWITNRPVVQGYYTGIGVAKVDPVSGKHIELAKNNALNDLVSEISVTISSNSVIRQFENNEDYQEEFESFSQATIRDNIEGYELVDSWGDDQHYWVYYKLSRQQYRMVKERKLERAKALAYDLFEKAKINEKNKEISNALSLYLKSLNALRYHLDEELSMLTDDGKIYLANEILSAILALYGKIELNSEVKEIKAKIAMPIDSTLAVSARYRMAGGKYLPVNNLPIKTYFLKGTGELTGNSMTNDSGMASFTLGRVTANRSFQDIRAEIDVRSMMESEDDQSDLLGELISLKSSAPGCNIHLVISPLLTFYVVKETEFDKPSERYAMSNEIKTYLSANFFTFTSKLEDADVKIVLDTRTVKGSYNQAHNLYTVYMDCYLSIYDARTFHKIYYKGFDQVRGQQVGNWENALKDVQLNTLKRFQEEILPEIHQLDF